MAVEVVWSREALRDVKEIAGYIRRDSPFYAKIVADKILEATRKIESAPEAASIVPEIGSPRFRERAVYSYRIIYRLTEGTATVLAVLHARRRLAAMEERLQDDRP